MAMEIITGSTGLPHVTSIDDAVRNGNVGYLNNKCVFTVYENMRADDITANQIRIYSGYGMNQGRYFKIAKDTYEDVTIRNGTTGYKRVDLIVAKYQMNSQTGFESVSLHVIEGRNGSTYEDPSYVTGDINGGDDEDDFPLYRIKLNGMALDGEPERMFNLVPDGGRVGLIEKMLNTGLMTDLASESRNRLNANGGNVDIGVKGVLPIGHGGTGQNSAIGSFTALANAATSNTTTPTDADTILTKSGPTWYQKAFSKIWDYIKGKLMGSTNYVTVANGGTGMGTIGSNKLLVGTGSTSFGTKDLVTVLENPTHNQVPTARAVLDAMSASGYGDMLSADYTTTVNGVKVISQGKGGTGSRDGSINGVRLGKSGNTMGYYDSNNNFKSFRQPTGNAQAAQVLRGYTFANATSDSLSGSMEPHEAVTACESVSWGGSTDNLYVRFPRGAYLENASFGYPEIRVPGTDLGDAAQANVLSGKTFTSASGLKLPGTMVNYSGANRCIVMPTGGMGNEQLALNRGYHDSVIVNRNGPYNAGYNAGIAAQKAEHWEETWEIEYMANDHDEHIPANSISRIKATWTGGNQGPILYWYDSAGNPVSSQTMASNTWYNVPTNYTVKEAVIMAWARQTVHPIVTRYANHLR